MPLTRVECVSERKIQLKETKEMEGEVGKSDSVTKFRDAEAFFSKLDTANTKH